MAVTYSQFVQEYSQFQDPNRKVKVEAALRDAAIKVGTAFGEFQDGGIMLWAAHVLSNDPMAESATLATAMNGANNFGSSRYKVLFDELVASARGGFFGAVSGTCG